MRFSFQRSTFLFAIMSPESGHIARFDVVYHIKNPTNNTSFSASFFFLKCAIFLIIFNAMDSGRRHYVRSQILICYLQLRLTLSWMMMEYIMFGCLVMWPMLMNVKVSRIGV